MMTKMVIHPRISLTKLAVHYASAPACLKFTA